MNSEAISLFQPHHEIENSFKRVRTAKIKTGLLILLVNGILRSPVIPLKRRTEASDMVRLGRFLTIPQTSFECAKLVCKILDGSIIRDIAESKASHLNLLQTRLINRVEIGKIPDLLDDITLCGLDRSYYEHVCNLALLPQTEDLVLVHLASVDGGHGARLPAPGKQADQSLKGITLAESDDERQHTDDGEPSENCLLMFPKSAKWIESHCHSSTYGD